MGKWKKLFFGSLFVGTLLCGGSVATPGAVSFNYQRKGIIKIEKKLASEDDLFMLVTELGAEDFLVEDDYYTIITKVEDLHKIKDALVSASNIFTYENSVEDVYRLLDKDPSTFSEMMNQVRADFEETETLADELEEILYNKVDLVSRNAVKPKYYSCIEKELYYV